MATRFLNSEPLTNLGLADQILFAQYGFGPIQQTPYACIHHAFEDHAKNQPQAIAVQHGDESISYADLDKKANRLARRLRQLGVKPGSRVCLLVQRSIAMVVGILAVLKAGGAYVPLDGGIVTDSTLEHVLRDSEAAVVLVLRAYARRVPSDMSLVLEDVIKEDDEADADDAKPEDLSSPRDGIYVIYTSGTTGKPKGVDVMHSNVTNLVCLAPGNVGMRPGLKVAQLLNIAFDMCAWEVLGSLANGCTLCIRGKTKQDWRDTLKMVDIVIATPSILNPYDPAEFSNIKYIATAGEVCPQALADRWSHTATFHNSCGPTEITIVNTVQPHTYGASLSIGVPTPNNNVYILDDKLKPVPIGQPGLMWAGGAGITRGYLNLPDKTAERYRLDPFANDGSMMFNTGDIGRWRADGQLDHLGRADDQVKVKGFRVELDGVAAAMETCKQVRVAAALLIGKELVGFVTPDDVDLDAVKEATAKVQPYYAVPSKILPMRYFPLTSNGKTDKRALRHLAETGSFPPGVHENSMPPPTPMRSDSEYRPVPLLDLSYSGATTPEPRTPPSLAPAVLIQESPTTTFMPSLDSGKYLSLNSRPSSSASRGATGGLGVDGTLGTPLLKTREMSVSSVTLDSPPPPYLLNITPDSETDGMRRVRRPSRANSGDTDAESRTPPPSFFNPEFTTFDNNSFLSVLGQGQRGPGSRLSMSVVEGRKSGDVGKGKLAKAMSFRRERSDREREREREEAGLMASGLALWSKIVLRVKKRASSSQGTVGEGGEAEVGRRRTNTGTGMQRAASASAAPALTVSL